MRSKALGVDYARGRLELAVESGLDTRWKTRLTDGTHLSVTQRHGTCLSVEEEMGRDAGMGGGAGPRSTALAGPRNWAALQEGGKGERRQAAGRGREFWAQPESEGKR